MAHRAATDLNWDIIKETAEVFTQERLPRLMKVLNKTSRANGDTPLILACMNLRN